MKSKVPASKKAQAQYRKRRYYKRKSFRPARSVPDRASLTENTILSTYSCVMNQMYEKRNFTIADNPRARAVAAAYQHYRIKKVTVIFRPQVDTFVGGGAVGGYTAPNLYYMIDKSGSIPSGITLAALKSMGAKPIRLDEQNIRVSWRPSVLNNVGDAGSGGAQIFGQYKVSPWLSTNENALNPGVFNVSSVDHLGIFWFIETPSGPSSLIVNVEAVLDVEFKKPINTSLTTPDNSVAIIA